MKVHSPNQPRAKEKIKHVRKASKPRTAGSKAFRRQPGEFPKAPQGQVHMEAVGSELRRHTQAQTCPHTHPEREVTGLHTGGGFLFLRVCAMLNQILPALDPKASTSAGVVTGQHLIPCIPRTREQVRLLTCALVPTKLGELGPAGHPARLLSQG